MLCHNLGRGANEWYLPCRDRPPGLSETMRFFLTVRRRMFVWFCGSPRTSTPTRVGVYRLPCHNLGRGGLAPPATMRFSSRVRWSMFVWFCGSPMTSTPTGVGVYRLPCHNLGRGGACSSRNDAIFSRRLAMCICLDCGRSRTPVPTKEKTILRISLVGTGLPDCPRRCNFPSPFGDVFVLVGATLGRQRAFTERPYGICFTCYRASPPPRRPRECRSCRSHTSSHPADTPCRARAEDRPPRARSTSPA